MAKKPKITVALRGPKSKPGGKVAEKAKKPKTIITPGPKVGAKKQYESLFSHQSTRYSSDDGTSAYVKGFSDDDYIAGNVRVAEAVLRKVRPDLPHPLEEVIWYKAKDRWERRPDDVVLDDFIKKGGRFEGASEAMGYSLYQRFPATIEAYAADVIWCAWELQRAYEGQQVEQVRYNALRFEAAYWQMFIKHRLELPYRVGQERLDDIPKMNKARGVAITEAAKQEQSRIAMAECLRVNEYLTRRLNRQPGLGAIKREAGKNLGVSLRTMSNRTPGLRKALGRPASRRKAPA